MSTLKDISKEDVECVAVAIWHGDTVEALGFAGASSWDSQEEKWKDRWRRIAVRALKVLANSKASHKVDLRPSRDFLVPNGCKNEHCNGAPEEVIDPTRKTTAEWCATHAVRMNDEGHASTASVLWGAEARIRELEAEISGLRAQSIPAAAIDILAERRRQVEAEGWTPAHDDEHAHDEIARAAACYALPQSRRWAITEGLWPWDRAWWKPGDRRRELVKAGALLVAEIERLDRKHQVWVERTAADVARDSDFNPI
jgi:hypothetical protein